MKSSLFNKITTSVLSLLIVLLVFAMIGSQLYSYVTDSHDTQDAVLCTIDDYISFEGVIIRDETVVSYDVGENVISYTYSDGSKVSEGDTIAQIYSSQEAAIAQQRIEQINDEIEYLERAQSPGTTDYVQPESISSKIDDYYRQVISAVNEGDYKTVTDTKDNMLLVMNIYNIISGISSDYNDKISQLSAEALQLGSQYPSAVGSVTAEAVGYFVSYCDGYEQTLDKESALTLSQSDVEDIIASQDEKAESVSSTAIGKMFESYSCYIVGVVDTDSRIAEDASLELSVALSDTVYDVDVVSVSSGDEEGKSVVVMSCETLDEALVAQRVQSMQLIFGEYTGLKVPRSAIRFQGEQKGVYVILGEDITFKKIDVIYEGDSDEGEDFVLSDNTSDESYLLLYDQILLEVVSEDDVQSGSKSDDESGLSESGED